MPNINDTIAARIAEDCKPVDREERFDAMLDDIYSFESIGGPFAYMQPSAVLREMDPTAYRCGVNDYADGEEWVEVDGEYYDRRDVENLLESMTDEIESETSDMETEREEAEENEEDTSSIDEQLAAKRADLKAVETFLD